MKPEGKARRQKSGSRHGGSGFAAGRGAAMLWECERAQVFSLDLLIAAGLFVLAAGITIGVYENASYSEKEARDKAELAAIALTASNAMLGAAGCGIESGMRENGYKAYGCNDTTKFSGMTKAQLMVPSDFNCSAALDSSPTTAANGGCRDTVGADALDVASIDRNILAPQETLTKKLYQRCIEGAEANCETGGPRYAPSKLNFRVWRK